MYRIDRSANRISRLTQKSFNELAFRERDHLQEWLVHQPDALGEELLILQKEFDGFDETRERLDLLALDKEGNLVVIENKLDDSGRDVTWQALKYTAYISTLKTGQIVEIYQRYLDRYCDSGSAKEKICEFLDVEDLQEAGLNLGNGQRMIFCGGSFPPRGNSHGDVAYQPWHSCPMFSRDALFPRRRTLFGFAADYPAA